MEVSWECWHWYDEVGWDVDGMLFRRQTEMIHVVADCRAEVPRLMLVLEKDIDV